MGICGLVSVDPSMQQWGEMEAGGAGETAIDKEWPHCVARSRVDQPDPAAGWQLNSVGPLGPTDTITEVSKIKSNSEPDWSKVTGIRGTLVSWREHTWLRFGLHNRRAVETNSKKKEP